MRLKYIHSKNFELFLMVTWKCQAMKPLIWHLSYWPKNHIFSKELKLRRAWFTISEHHTVFPTVANIPQMGNSISIHLISSHSSHFISFYLNSSHFDTHLRLLRFILQLIMWSRISIYWVLFNTILQMLRENDCLANSNSGYAKTWKLSSFVVSVTNN